MTKMLNSLDQKSRKKTLNNKENAELVVKNPICKVLMIKK